MPKLIRKRCFLGFFIIIGLLFSFFYLVFNDNPRQTFTLNEEGAEYRIRRDEYYVYRIYMKKESDEAWWSTQVLSSNVDLGEFLDKPVHIYGDFTSKYGKVYCGEKQSICDETHKVKATGYHIKDIELVH